MLLHDLPSTGLDEERKTGHQQRVVLGNRPLPRARIPSRTCACGAIPQWREASRGCWERPAGPCLRAPRQCCRRDGRAFRTSCTATPRTTRCGLDDWPRLARRAETMGSAMVRAPARRALWSGGAREPVHRVGWRAPGTRFPPPRDGSGGGARERSRLMYRRPGRRRVHVRTRRLRRGGRNREDSQSASRP